MNKGSTRLLVIVGLVVLLLCSWYTLINDNAKVNNEYNQYIALAREKAETKLYQVALENYEKARTVKDSIELRDEMAQAYWNFGNASLYEEFCNMMVEDYPYEKAGYERLASYYSDGKAYSLFFDIKKAADKRGVDSARIRDLAQQLEYAYALKDISAVEIGGFSGGLAVAQRSKGYWGMLNEIGSTALSFNYVKLSDYANGVMYAETKDGDYALIDSTGKLLSRVADERKIEDCSAYNEGKMAVKYNGKYYYCDGSFNELFGSYDYASVFTNGVAAVKNGDKWAVINGKGETVTDFVFDDIKLDDVRVAFRNERAFAKKGNTYILIDTNGNQIGNGAWEDVDMFSNDMVAAAKKNGKWGFIDADGKEVADYQYQYAKSFYNGLAAVQIADKWGYIGLDYTLKIDALFDEACDFTKKGTAFVKEDTTWKLIQIYRLA